MNTFYIITNSIKDPNHDVTQMIMNLIEREGGHSILAVTQDKKHNIPKEVDGIITLGGDGTLIRAASELHAYNIPIIGINLGTLGYLTEIEKNGIEEGIVSLFNQNVLIEKRMMIQGELLGKQEVALNDIVLNRYGGLRTIQFTIYVNGEYLHEYKADGVIISTPTGSTAYSLSAGGPIVEPTASMFIITPICAHSLNSSSIVLSSEDVIEIILGAGRENTIEHASVSFDGENDLKMKTGDKIRISKATKTTQLIKLSSVSFLETLRRKMAGN